MSDAPALVLVACAVLFALRVAGQLLVVVAHPRWLPPMEGWQSGLLPYPVLLSSQLAIIAVQARVVRDVVDGGTATPDPGVHGIVLVALAGVYALGMAYRTLQRRRYERSDWWSRGTIPIVFHLVLATFLAAWGGTAIARA